MRFDSTAKYAELINDFVLRRTDAAQFEASYLASFKHETAALPDEVFHALDQLFADVDAFCPDPELRGEDDLNEQQLRERCVETLKKLESYSRTCKPTHAPTQF